MVGIELWRKIPGFGSTIDSKKTFYFQTVAWSLETKNIVPITAKKLKTRTKCTACGASSVGR